MSKFNQRDVRPRAGAGVIKTTGQRGDVTTYEGAPAYTRDTKSELFQLAVVNMVGEDTFYETGGQRDDRYTGLVRSVALADPTWVTQFITWLRGPGNMRSASVVAAAEMARAWQEHLKAHTYVDGASEVAARIKADGKTPFTLNFNAIGPVRQAVTAALQRPDEPGELLGYWLSHYGRRIPKPVKRGITDALRQLYTELNALKYDTDGHPIRFGDVLELTHPDPRPAANIMDKLQVNRLEEMNEEDVLAYVASAVARRSALFKYLIDDRHGRTDVDLSQLPMIENNRNLRRLATSDPRVLLDSGILRDAGMTWEDTLSLAGSQVDKGKLWDAIIPNMNYMALLRNLRNFDQADISDDRAIDVELTLEDPDQVAKSRQFPYRFLSAYLNTDSDRWKVALGNALNHSLVNLPALPGGTLVLVDTSGSMENKVSEKSKVTRVQAGALFGVALAARGERAELRGFAGDGFAWARSNRGQETGRVSFVHQVRKGASVLGETERFCRRVGEVGHGTMIAAAIKESFDPTRHDRVIVVTDLQTFGSDHGRGDVNAALPPDVPLYAFNLGGYKNTPLDTRRPNRFELGGLTDATFRVIPLLERGNDQSWPWETK